MIVFDLQCSFNHKFEVWFKNSKEFNKQNRNKLINCPVCGDKEIEKSLMTPNIGKKSSSKKSKNAINKTLINKMSKFKKTIEKNFEYVGENFADEAIKIKYGEVKERSIYGEADQEQTKKLVEEEIDFQQLPWTSDKKNN